MILKRVLKRFLFEIEVIRVNKLVIICVRRCRGIRAELRRPGRHTWSTQTYAETAAAARSYRRAPENLH